MEVKYCGKNIEDVTAAKIHMVNENPRKVANPRIPIAREMKKRIRKGPDLSRFPVIRKTRKSIRSKRANPTTIL
jgi:hypothetical protein